MCKNRTNKQTTKKITEYSRYVVTTWEDWGNKHQLESSVTTDVLRTCCKAPINITYFSNVFKSYLAVPFANSSNIMKNQIWFTKVKASPVSNNPRGILHWTFFMLPWKNYSIKLQRWPLLELKDFTFSYPRMAFSVKHQSASKKISAKMTQLKVFKIWKHTVEGKHSLSDPRFEIDAIMKQQWHVSSDKERDGSCYFEKHC